MHDTQKRCKDPTLLLPIMSIVQCTPNGFSEPMQRVHVVRKLAGGRCNDWSILANLCMIRSLSTSIVANKSEISCPSALHQDATQDATRDAGLQGKVQTHSISPCQPTMDNFIQNKTLPFHSMAQGASQSKTFLNA